MSPADVWFILVSLAVAILIIVLVTTR